MSRRSDQITILAVLQLISSLLSIGFGLIYLLLALGIIVFGVAADPAGSGFVQLVSVIAGFVILLAIADLTWGAIGLFVTYGLFNRKSWAWLGTFIIQGTEIMTTLTWSTISAGSTAFGTAVDLALAGVIVYLLLQPDVKQEFGR